MRTALQTQQQWFSKSALAFADGSDPVEKMLSVAQTIALDAIQQGWEGPPFDPFRLAELLRIKTVPCEDVRDARAVPVGTTQIQIEYNPGRPIQRIRFSIAHEIAHTFFPDCAHRIRYRATKNELSPGDWELELLCNVGAAELLMPIGSLPGLKDKLLTIEGLLTLRKDFEVSAESLALRYVSITEQPMAAVAISRVPDASAKRYQVDYIIGSRTWPIRLQKGFLLPEGTVAEQCTAIGHVAKGRESWTKDLQVNVECVGLPSYSDNSYPRVLGLLMPENPPQGSATKLRHVIGDATQPTGTGTKLLVHIVNDKTPNWGAGFGRVVRESWPPIQDEFRKWALKDSANFRLGNIFITKISDGFFIAPMICQHGYGESPKQRLRYVSLRECLLKVKVEAEKLGAGIHMPRIGTGYGGGSWCLIEQIIDESLCRNGISVTVYSLPGAKAPNLDRGLFD